MSINLRFINTYPPEAGEVKKVRMEHIWVEAATDYFPSRGAKNRTTDSWIPLDASFKLYEYSDGIDMQSITGIDINSTIDSFINSGEINTASGYAIGFDPQIRFNENFFRLKTLSKYGRMVLKRGLFTNGCKKTLKSVHIVP